jgi:hypothetical protein
MLQPRTNLLVERRLLRQAHLDRADVARPETFSRGTAESPPFLRIPRLFVKQECSLDPTQLETVTQLA